MADIAKLIYKKNEMGAWEGDAVKSSNQTYDNVIYLTQAEYDALPSKNPNTLYSTPEKETWAFLPANEWDNWDILTMWADWIYWWEEPQFVTWAQVDSKIEDKIESEWLTTATEVANMIQTSIEGTTASTNHLEEARLVWELYSLSDKLFIQDTPTYENSFVEATVWNTNVTKEVHIQRIWSWNESNKLKLKIKKVWAPTYNFKVDIRPWIKEVVTANVEAYWYWNPNSVLAIWEVSYEDISSDWSDVEITLNTNIWGTRWQLLNVVAYQDNDWTKTVDASNYYIIWCDTAQCWEAFRFVNSDWWTQRSRSKLMPYCVSLAFEEQLLVKYWTDTVVWNINHTYDFWTKLVNAWEQRYASAIINDVSVSNTWNTAMTASFSWKWDSSWRSDWFHLAPFYKIWTNGTETAIPHKYWSWEVPQVDVTWLSIPANSALIFYWHANTDSGNWRDISYTRTLAVTVSWTYTVRKVPKDEAKPRSIVDLWEVWRITILWVHSDWTFYVNPHLVEFSSDWYSSTAADITQFYWRLYVKIWNHTYGIPLTSRT